MNRIILLLLILTSGCSSLHPHQAFYLDPASQSKAKTVCKEADIYGDMIELEIADAKFKMFFWYKQGFTFLGPVGIPFFPLFWKGSKISSLGLRVIPLNKAAAQIDFKTWLLVLDATNVITPTFSNSESLNFSSTVHNIGAGRWFVYHFKKQRLPEKLKLVIQGATLNNKEVPKKNILFNVKKKWHYVPLIYRHTEWPYTHELPCKSS